MLKLWPLSRNDLDMDCWELSLLISSRRVLSSLLMKLEFVNECGWTLPRKLVLYNAELPKWCSVEIFTSTGVLGIFKITRNSVLFGSSVDKRVRNTGILQGRPLWFWCR